MKTSLLLPFLAIVGLFSSHSMHAQIELGADIDGEAPGDELGWSVSLSADGSRLAVGAPRNDGGGTDAGQARVYAWDGMDWIQLGSDLDGEGPEDHFGESVSLSADGNRLAVGAPENDGSGIFAGKVRVFEWDGSNWTYLGAGINGAMLLDHFGTSVALSADGNRLAVGAPTSTGGGTEPNTGQVRVYEWDEVGWAQLGADLNGAIVGGNFGRSLSLSADGNWLAVGAAYADVDGELGAGQVKVFAWDGEEWTPLGTELHGEHTGDLFGKSVSLSADGQTLAVGVPLNDAIGTEAGLVEVFVWGGAEWDLLGAPVYGEGWSDQSGTSVSLSADGRRIAIGATHNDQTGLNAGHVRVFAWNGSAWTKLGADLNGEAMADFSGRSVSLSADGLRVAIGATGNDGNGELAGQVRVYEVSVVSTEGLDPERQLWVYPNPTTGRLEWSGPPVSMVRIVDGVGKVFREGAPAGSMLDLSDLPGGVYFLQIWLAEGVVVRKVVKW